MKLPAGLLAAFAGFSLATACAGEDVSFWVWHRTSPLSPDESAELTRQGVDSLYWQAGELTAHRNGWKWSRAPIAAAGLAQNQRVTPVLRLESEVPDPFESPRLSELRALLSKVAEGGPAVQLDYDCPDRLLARYAAALVALRRDLPELSITALALWIRRPEWPRLAAAVSEVTPMFYDLQADPTGLSTPPPPLLDPAQLSTELKLWSKCGARWRAGLPAFARLTIFDSTGLSRGQIPNWSWPELIFHRHLRAARPTHLGVTAFRVDEDTRVARTPVRAEETVVSRFVDRDALAAAVKQAAAAGAAGVTFFRLPDGTDPAGRSLTDLAALLTDEKPRLELRRSGPDRVTLRNVSGIDLPPRLAGPRDDRDRGYALEIDAPAPVFREAVAGDFWRVTAHVDPDAAHPRPAAVPAATRLTFWFSDLRAGGELRTGLLQFAPGTQLDRLRWRVLDTESARAWTPFAPP